MSPLSIRVMIVDDHAMIRRGLRAYLLGRADIILVGEAGDGQEALDAFPDAMPDVILLDIQMPHMGGIDALREIQRRRWDVKVIMLTSFQDQDLVKLAIQEGARGYLLKDVEEEDLVAAIRLVYAGHILLPPGASPKPLMTGAPPDPIYELSHREREILALVAAGDSNKEIARKMVLSLSTVKFHVSNIFTKLDVASRTEAAALALAHGLKPGR